MKIVLASVFVLLYASLSRICSAGKCNESEVYRKCNHNSAQVHVKGPHPSKLHHRIYCQGVQSLIKCLSKDPCNGAYIKHYRFLVLQAAIMSKKTVCPRLRYDKLKRRAAAVAHELGLPDLEQISAKGDKCAKRTFLSCAVVYSQKMEEQRNICDDFMATINCFKKLKARCSSLILRKYREILKKLGVPLISSAKKHAADMCF